LPERRLTAVPTPLTQVTELTKRRRAVDLATLTDVRREMSRVYRDVHRGRLRADEGGKRIYMLVSIAKVVELAEVQPRVEAIERAINRREK
jgi:hypothetical protein